MRTLTSIMGLLLFVGSNAVAQESGDDVQPSAEVYVDVIADALKLASDVDGSEPLSVSKLTAELLEDIVDSRPTVDDDAINIVLDGEEMPDVTQDLLDCAADEGCDDHPQALFWVAAHAISDLGSRQINPNPLRETYSPLLASDALYLCVERELECDGGDADVQQAWAALRKLAVREDEIYAMFLKAHERGSCMASNEIGNIHRDGGLGRRQDHEEAAKWFQVGIDCGDELSNYNLARLMSLGHIEGTASEIDDLLRVAYRGGLPDAGHIIIQRDFERGKSLAYMLANWPIRLKMRSRDDRHYTLEFWGEPVPTRPTWR